MSSTLLLILALLALGLLFVGLIISLLWQKSLVFTKAPFVCLPLEVIPEIINQLNLTPESIFYDLGSGDGRILAAAHQKTPLAKFYGVEKELLAHIIAKHKLKNLIKTGHLNLIHKNFFKTNLSQASHVFTYLFPELMNDLLPKLQKELKPGTILISCDFPFSKKSPEQIVTLSNRPPHALGKRLLVYKF